MKIEPDTSTKESLFKEQIKAYTVLDHDLAVYYRASPGTPERSYEYLMKIAKAYLQRQREDRNRKQVQDKLSARDLLALPANMSGGEKEKSKHKHDKGKDRDRSQSRGRSKSPRGKGSSKGKSPKRSDSQGSRGSKGSKGKGRGRSPSKGKSKGSSNQVCRFFLKGVCNLGDKCVYKHEQPKSALPAQNKGNANASETESDASDSSKSKGKKRRNRKKSIAAPALALVATAIAVSQFKPAAAATLNNQSSATMYHDILKCVMPCTKLTTNQFVLPKILKSFSLKLIVICEVCLRKLKT